MGKAHDMKYGDPKCEEAVSLLMRAAAAEGSAIAGPEVDRIQRAVLADEDLLAWFIYVAGRVTMIHVREQPGDPNDALRDFEESFLFALRGGEIDEDD